MDDDPAEDRLLDILIELGYIGLEGACELQLLPRSQFPPRLERLAERYDVFAR